MRIVTNKSPEPAVVLGDIACGEVFMFTDACDIDDCYMKLEAPDGIGLSKECSLITRLRDGGVVRAYSYEIIRRVNCKLVIE